MTTILKKVERKKVDKLKKTLSENTFAPKAFREAYKKLLSLIDAKSRDRLMRAERIINKYANQILFNCGWFVSPSGVSTQDTKNIDGKHEEYRIIRDYTGYHLQDYKPKNLHECVVRSAEEAFFNDRQLELQILHMAYLMRTDMIYHRRYKVVKPENEALAEELRAMLRYDDPSRLILPPEEPKIIDFAKLKK